MHVCGCCPLLTHLAGACRRRRTGTARLARWWRGASFAAAAAASPTGPPARRPRPGTPAPQPPPPPPAAAPETPGEHRHKLVVSTETPSLQTGPCCIGYTLAVVASFGVLRAGSLASWSMTLPPPLHLTGLLHSCQAGESDAQDDKQQARSAARRSARKHLKQVAVLPGSLCRRRHAPPPGRQNAASPAQQRPPHDGLQHSSTRWCTLPEGVGCRIQRRRPGEPTLEGRRWIQNAPPATVGFDRPTVSKFACRAGR